MAMNWSSPLTKNKNDRRGFIRGGLCVSYMPVRVIFALYRLKVVSGIRWLRLLDKVVSITFGSVRMQKKIGIFCGSARSFETAHRDFREPSGFQQVSQPWEEMMHFALIVSSTTSIRGVSISWHISYLCSIGNPKGIREICDNLKKTIDRWEEK